jgi:transposase
MDGVRYCAEVFLSAKGLGTMAITRLTGKSKPTVWRWQARYLQEGVDGLFRDKSRPPGRAPLSAAIIRRVVELTHKPLPFEQTHRSARPMACATGISVSSVRPNVEIEPLVEDGF